MFDEAFNRKMDQNMETNEGETLFSCNMCKETFLTEDSVKAHIITHGEKFFEPLRVADQENPIDTHTEKAFLTEDSVKTHITTRVEQTPVVFEVFDETFREVNQENDIETDMGDTLFSFLTEDSVQTHITTHVEQTPVVFEVFDETCREVDQENGIETHMGDTRFACNICKKTFLTEDGMKTHIVTHENTHLVCEIFDETFKKEDQENHIDTQAGKTLFSCNMCEKTFSTEDSVKTHITTHVEETPLVFKVFDETFSKVDQDNYIESNEGETLFPCDICKTSFSTKDSLKKHIMTHEKTSVLDKTFSRKIDTETDSVESSFSCNICEKIFSAEDSLKNHISTHDSDSLICKKFEKTLRNIKQENQMETEEGETLFFCDICKTSFSTKDGLKKHIMTHEEKSTVDETQVGENPFVCEVCGKQFSRNAELKSNMRIHAGKNSYCCSMCEKDSSHNPTEETRSHVQRHTGENAGIVVGCSIPNKNTKVTKLKNKRENSHYYEMYKKDFSHNPTEEARFSCQICDEAFFEKGDLEVHVKCHTDLPEIDDVYFSIQNELNSSEVINEEIKKMIFYCEVCGDAFLMKSDLEAHSKSHTKVTPFKFEMFDKDLSIKKELYSLETETEKFLHTCTICDRTFSKIEQLERHLGTHTGVYPFSCTLCGKGFSYNCSLKNHMRTHTNELPFTCPVCNKAFSRKDKLQVHFRTHTGETPYSCGICGKSFSHRCSLNDHVVIHTGANAFVCEVCAKAFARKEKLKLHMRTHTGETPYSCTICNKAFSYNCTLKNHMKIHTGERPFSCDFCGKDFSRKDKLQSHVRIHTRETPYPCKFCSKAFSHNASLKTHMRIHAEEISICT